MGHRSRGGQVEGRFTGRPRGTPSWKHGWVAAAIVLVALWPRGPAEGSSSLPGEQGLAQLPPPTCQGESTVDPSAELRLVRDVDGTYWQIQTGCRHLVVPFLMDSATLAAIPQGEDVGWVRRDPSVPPPPPEVLAPAYALPAGTTPLGRGALPAPLAETPGVLLGYREGALVVDPRTPEAVWLLAGGLRHRVLVYFPYCAVYRLPAPLCGAPSPDSPSVGAELLARGGDPALVPPWPYLLQRSVEVAADCRRLYPQLRLPRAESCAAVYEWLLREALASLPPAERPGPELVPRLARTIAEQAASYVATLAEVPVGEPTSSYGWARGESVVLGERPTLLEARRCDNPNPDRAQPQPGDCSVRFTQARVINLAQFNKEPEAYTGQDVRLPAGVACDVRYDRARNVTTLSYGLGNENIAVVMPGRSPDVYSNTVLEIAAVVGGRVGDTVGQAGQLVVFEYRVLPRSGVCLGGQG